MVDARVWAALEQLAGQPHIARGEEGAGVECVLDLARVPSLSGRSYQRFLVAQPVKLGGLGIRSLVETRHPAFLGGLEQALPFMVSGELCELPLAPSLQALELQLNFKWLGRTWQERQGAFETIWGRNLLDCWQIRWMGWEAARWMAAPGRELFNRGRVCDTNFWSEHWLLTQTGMQDR